MAHGQGKEMRVRGLGRAGAPCGPGTCRGKIVRQKLMPRAEGCQHAREDLRRICQAHAPAAALNGDTDEAELHDGRGVQLHVAAALGLADPLGRAEVIRVIGPAPGEEEVHVQKVFHGKSASISRTAALVSGGASGSGAKIVAPVCGHFTRPGAAGAASLPAARRRRYSDTVILKRFASARMRRASSSVTLKVSVFTGIIVIPDP